MKETDLIEVEKGLWMDKLNVIARLEALGLVPPRSKKKWWEFWK